MKLTIKNTPAVVLTNLVPLLPKAAVLAAATYLGVWLVAGFVHEGYGIGVDYTWIAPIVAIASAIVLLSKQAFEAVLHARGTWVELSDTTITFQVSGFFASTMSVPINEVSALHVQQGFIEQLLGVSHIVILQTAGSLSVFGFEYAEAAKLSQEFATKSHRQSGKKSNKT